MTLKKYAYCILLSLLLNKRNLSIIYRLVSIFLREHHLEHIRFIQIEFFSLDISKYRLPINYYCTSLHIANNMPSYETFYFDSFGRKIELLRIITNWV